MDQQSKDIAAWVHEKRDEDDASERDQARPGTKTQAPRGLE